MVESKEIKLILDSKRVSSYNMMVYEKDIDKE